MIFDIQTEPEDSQIGTIGFESMIFNQRVFQRLEVRFRQIDHAAAFGADQMVVPAVLPGMVTYNAVTYAYFRRQPESFQQLKRAIDRRNIGVGIFLPNTLRKFLRR